TMIEITGLSGGAQEHLSRYLVRLQSDLPFEYAGDDMPTITVVVDGEEKTVESWNDKETKNITLLVPFDVAPFEERTELTVKAGTVFHNYEIASDVTIIMQGYDLLLKQEPKPITLSVGENEDGSLRAAAQEHLSRYLFYLDTDQTGLENTRMWNNNTVVIDEGTEKEKVAPIYYVGGIANPGQEEYDTTMILAVLEYNDIVAGATVSSEVGKHKITIKADSLLGNLYKVTADLVIYVGNEHIALSEEDIPELPVGVFKATSGIENKTIEYSAKKIEDYIAEAPVVKLKADAKRDDDNNVLLESHDASLGFCKSLKIATNDAEPQIKFRSKYTGGDIYLAFEIRSQLDGGNYWLGDGAPIVRLRYVEDFAESETEHTQCLFFDFFNNGLQASPQFSIFHNDEFKLEKDQEFFVEFGAVNKQDAQGNDGFVFFVCVTQGEKVAYGECLMSGDFNVSNSGSVTIYQSPANSAKLIEGAFDQPENDVASFTIMSVDSQREIDGVVTPIGAMSLYDPDITYATNYDKYDISDLVPLGKGITYTKIEGDVTSKSQAMINAMSIPVKNGGYSVKMKLKFTGTDFGCTFAFRGKNALAKSGYTLTIAENIVLCGVMSTTSPFEPNVEYDVELGCIDFYIAGERNASGAMVYLKVNGEMIISDEIDKISGTGGVFCGLIEGAGGSTVTISSSKQESEQTQIKIVTTANKDVVFKDNKATLGYTSNMNTIYDEVTYEVVKGKATIKGDGIFSETNGKIVVRVKVVNEYGTFYGEQLIINEGQGVNVWLIVGISAGIVVLGLAGTLVIISRKKKRRDK
ncbi:MAG: hypothetical protein IKA99_00360, partial [Clostridia bacterium]|nr:hypothetical protein [Clostridia bacterium]